MSAEVELLCEVWEIVHVHINRKDRVEVAEAVLRSFESHVDLDDIHIYKNEFDGAMKTAIMSVFDDVDHSDWD